MSKLLCNTIIDFKMVCFEERHLPYHSMFLFSGGHLKTLISLSWDEGRTAGLELDVLYEYERRLYLSVSSRVYTPLVNWKVTKIEGTWVYQFGMLCYSYWVIKSSLSDKLFNLFSNCGNWFLSVGCVWRECSPTLTMSIRKLKWFLTENYDDFVKISPLSLMIFFLELYLNAKVYASLFIRVLQGLSQKY